MDTSVQPVGVMPAEQVDAALAAAATATSPYDSVPWSFRCTSTGIELHAERTQDHPGVDPFPRRLRVACGAALLNLRVAVRALGVTASVRLLPDPAQPDWLAVLHPLQRSPATSAELTVAQPLVSGFIAPARLRAATVAEPARNALRQAARMEQAWLATIDATQLSQFNVLAAYPQPAMQNGTAPVSQPASEGFEPNQLVAVIGTFGDLPLAQLQAGQSMQRALLTAINLGLQPSLEPQVGESPAGRQQLRQLIGGALWPQMVLRLHHLSPAPARNTA